MKEKIFKKGIKRRVFSAILSLAVVISLFTICSNTSYAGGPYTFTINNDKTWQAVDIDNVIQNAKAGESIVVSTGINFYWFGKGGPSGGYFCYTNPRTTQTTVNRPIPAGYKIKSINLGTHDGDPLFEIELEPIPVAVSGVTLNKESTSLAEGNNETLSVTVTPNNATNKAVTWSSSDEAVATVDENGEITAVSVGTATITVKSVADNTKTATCLVTVTEPAAALAGTATITGTAKYGQKLTASLSGSNNTGTLSYQWKRDESDISGATSNEYTLTLEDITHEIKVAINSSVETGTITSAAVGPVEKADTPAPTVTGVACTTEANDDGKITGTSADMEYSTTTDFASPTDCSATETTGLENGTYYVRVKETATHKAGAYATVVVNAYSASSGGGSGSGITPTPTPTPDPTPTPAPAPAPAPVPAPNVYTVPVTSENTVHVEATIDNNVATVSEITSETIANVGNNNSVVIDVSGANVDSVVVSKSTLETLTNAVNSTDNKINTVEVKLSNAKMEFDKIALNSLLSQADGSNIKLCVDDNDVSRFNETQQNAIKNKNVAAVFDAYVESNGTRIHDFDGGNVYVTVEFTPVPGTDTRFYHVEYVAPDGQIERYETRFTAEGLQFIVPHLSDYVIVYDTSAPVKSPKTGDNVAWIYVLMLMGAATIGFGLLKRKSSSR